MQRWIIWAAAAAAAAAGATASAQSYPAKPIRIVIPFVPGGPSDTVGRAIGSRFLEYLGQPAIVENRPGANGAIAAEFVAKSDPDGYTLLVGSIGVFSINAALYKDLRYDPVRDFAPITLAVTTPNVLVTKLEFPPHSVQALVDYAKKNPGKISYASSGTGASDHLISELFKQMTGTFGVHIPYRGGAAVVTDLLGGQVEASFQNMGNVATQIRAGKIRALAVTANSRAAALPGVPTMVEAGYPDLIVTSWQAAAAPARTPREVVARLNDAMVKALRSPDVRDRLTAIGFDVVASTPEEFGQFMKSEVERWTLVVQRGLEANRHPTATLDAGALLALDGRKGYGQAVGLDAMRMAIERAKQHGSCVMALGNTHHLGRIGHWAELAVQVGLVSIHFVNVISHARVAPYGGRDARFGTNPCCIGVPLPGEPPFILDYATSAVAQGKLRVAHNKREKVPAGRLIDNQGNPTDDPRYAVVPPFGAMLPFGEHKGYGMALACELLGGALSGGGTWHYEESKQQRVLNGMLAIVIDPVRLGTAPASSAKRGCS